MQKIAVGEVQITILLHFYTFTLFYLRTSILLYFPTSILSPSQTPIPHSAFHAMRPQTTSKRRTEN